MREIKFQNKLDKSKKIYIYIKIKNFKNFKLFVVNTRRMVIQNVLFIKNGNLFLYSIHVFYISYWKEN